MPCNAEGFVRVNISFNTTALSSNVLYRRDINLYFYRSCYKDGLFMNFCPPKLLFFGLDNTKIIIIMIEHQCLPMFCRCVGG